MPALFCKTMLVSWALVFTDAPNPDGMAAYCFHTEQLCEQAKLGAEAALYFAGFSGSVSCERQPPETDKPRIK